MRQRQTRSRRCHGDRGAAFSTSSHQYHYRPSSCSIHELAPMPALRQGKPSGGTLRVIRKNRASAVDRDVIDDKTEAIRTLAGFVDRAAECDAGVRKINQSTDVPCGTVARGG